MLIEQTQREARVRFQHPIRVVTLEGQPRVIRTLTSNVSRDGLFVRMPEPLPPGMKVALSLEAGGRALALAQAEVRWNGPDANEITERFPGCGVRFTEFLHPRAEELVRYLVKNLDTGKPLALAPPEKRWMKWLPFAGGGALLACAAAAAVILWDPGEVTVDEPADVPAIQLQAGTPTVLPLPSGEGRGEGKSPSNPIAAVIAPPTAAPEPVAPTTSPAVVASPPEPERVAPTPELVVGPPAPERDVVAPPQPKAIAPPDPTAAASPSASPVAPGPAAAPKPAPVVAKVAVAPVELKVESPKVPPLAPEPSAGPKSAPVVKVAVAPVELKVEAPKAPPPAATPEPVAAATKPALAKPPPPTSEKKKKAERQGDVKLAAGASPQLHWEVTGTELRLVPQLPDGVQLSRAFVLAGPARAVFDLSGGAPPRSLTVPAAPPYATGVRIGKQAAGTRIVVDLDAAPKNTKQLGDALVLAF